MKTIITRADDCGSSQGVNTAIFEAADAGFIKNISLMACGEYIKEGAERLSERKDVCFGMHFVINSEWDRVKFAPVSPKSQIPMLLNAEGEFYSSPELMVKTIGKEKMVYAQEELLRELYIEWKNQLEKLRSLGFVISYGDTHMFSERFLPGLKNAMKQWLADEKLIDHRYFYYPVRDMDAWAKNTGVFENAAMEMADGQYFYLAHPAAETEDMYLTGNEKVPTEQIVRNRSDEYRFVTSAKTLEICRKNGIRLIRYDEAVSGDYESVEGWLGVS